MYYVNDHTYETVNISRFFTQFTFYQMKNRKYEPFLDQMYVLCEKVSAHPLTRGEQAACTPL